MRKDMKHLLTERPRHNSDARSMNCRLETRAAGRDPDLYDELPQQASMHKTGGVGRHRRTKELNENLNPLKRFLLSRVGKPWDEVYSEIRKNLRIENAVDLHIMQHLYGYVTVNTYLDDDGRISESGGFGYNYGPLEGRWRQGETYVDPTTGILCTFKAKSRKKKKPKRIKPKKHKDTFTAENVFILYKENKVMIKTAGEWAVYDLKPWKRFTIVRRWDLNHLEPIESKVYTTDALFGMEYRDVWFENHEMKLRRYYNGNVYADPSTKRTPGKKELKRMRKELAITAGVR